MPASRNLSSSSADLSWPFHKCSWWRQPCFAHPKFGQGSSFSPRAPAVPSATPIDLTIVDSADKNASLWSIGNDASNRSSDRDAPGAATRVAGGDAVGDRSPSRSRSVPVKLSLTFVTAVPLALFSSMATVASAMAGALSLRLFRLTVIAAVSDRVPSDGRDGQGERRRRLEIQRATVGHRDRAGGRVDRKRSAGVATGDAVGDRVAVTVEVGAGEAIADIRDCRAVGRCSRRSRPSHRRWPARCRSDCSG